MLEVKQGEVTEILSRRKNITKVIIKINKQLKKGINYNNLTGTIQEGDRVIVNTTATSLELGTGGYDFIIHILNNETKLADQGHIMKLRYTPYQLQTCSVEEKASPYHKLINDFTSLDQTPVVVATLHSMLPAIAIMIKARIPGAKITYVMTDGAALPIDFSNLVKYLKRKNLVDQTITIGHAFGGDLEAVNIYSGLIASYVVNKADVIIVSMGPGIVGTGTKYGFSGTEQADVLHAVDTLEGIPIAVPRISFHDKRERHYGLSHHSRTNLGQLTKVSCLVGIPYFNLKYSKIVKQQLIDYNIKKRHKVIYRKGGEVLDNLRQLDYNLTTMGRSYKQEKEYFMTAGTAGIIATEQLKGDS